MVIQKPGDSYLAGSRVCGQWRTFAGLLPEPTLEFALGCEFRVLVTAVENASRLNLALIVGNEGQGPR